MPEGVCGAGAEQQCGALLERRDIVIEGVDKVVHQRVTPNTVKSFFGAHTAMSDPKFWHQCFGAPTFDIPRMTTHIVHRIFDNI